MNNITIVSGFLTNINQRASHDINKYIELGMLFLRAKIQKIIFVDKEMYEKIIEYENEYTKIVLIDRHQYDLYKYMNNMVLTNFSLNTDNSSKDTMEYMFTMCNKTEWIRQAIELNYFNTEQFIWVDFGIRYVFKRGDDEFVDIVESLHDKTYENIRMGNIWDLNCLYKFDILRDITWYFAGGVFGGNKDKLIHFANLMKDKCLQIMDQEKTIMWEVNIWYLIYLENKELFDTFHCGHDDTIITNY